MIAVDVPNKKPYCDYHAPECVVSGCSRPAKFGSREKDTRQYNKCGLHSRGNLPLRCYQKDCSKDRAKDSSYCEEHQKENKTDLRTICAMGNCSNWALKTKGYCVEHLVREYKLAAQRPSGAYHGAEEAQRRRFEEMERERLQRRRDELDMARTLRFDPNTNIQREALDRFRQNRQWNNAVRRYFPEDYRRTGPTESPGLPPQLRPPPGRGYHPARYPGEGRGFRNPHFP